MWSEVTYLNGSSNPSTIGLWPTEFQLGSNPAVILIENEGTRVRIQANVMNYLFLHNPDVLLTQSDIIVIWQNCQNYNVKSGLDVDS